MDKHLPAEIALNIFFRLPVESVLECRRVCKTWRNLLLHDTYIADMHLYRQLGQLDGVQRYHNNSNIYGTSAAEVDLCLLFMIVGYEQNVIVKSIYYDRINRDDKQYPSKKITRRINHLPMKNQYPCNLLLSSCNGLICISSKRGRDDCVYICNPITREYVDLPRFREKNLYTYIVNGFGYHPSTKEYKVVRINYNYPAHVGHIQVYTLGDGRGWRDKGVITYLFDNVNMFPCRGILVNAALHWLDIVEKKIMAFDLADEVFYMVPSPPCFGPSIGEHYLDLQELGSCLCIVHYNNDESIDIWLFKKTKNNNTRYNVKEQDKYQSWKWSKEFSIACEGHPSKFFAPLALTKSREILLWHKYDAIIYRYDSTTRTLEKLLRYDASLKFSHQIILHNSSFVSLKALGEKDVDIL
ncbi:F-box domain [Macleaya cordata]|uniref:F-box domain n=1 Tax=Macleaya cordata TaxID=56857 RepID=A0A200QN94_MACCD|nr:F-box domain [Macleaya cordata]